MGIIDILLIILSLGFAFFILIRSLKKDKGCAHCEQTKHCALKNIQNKNKPKGVSH
ncbi:MAG: FeoB-associated Cys-rich membrane protein [Spirochaetes bacterium]|nr:FeoB-associated Cys-rich membrane protein [Spirochaetota bacterium]